MGLVQKIGDLFGGNSHSSTSPFDVCKHQDEEGDFWLSDELAPYAGYVSTSAYRNLRRVMLDVAASYGYGPKDFRVSADVGTDSQVKKEGGQTRVYRMSRKFLMSLAHKLDIRKEEVRLLHKYLDIQVRRSELSDEQRALLRGKRTDQAAKEYGHSIGWSPIRNMNKVYNCEIIGVLLGRIGGDMFSTIYDTIHFEITGKHAPQLRKDMGMKKGASPFDGYDAQCLMIVSNVAVSLLTLFDEGKLDQDSVVEQTKRLIRLHKASQLSATGHDAIGKKESENGHVIIGAIRKAIAS
jgi:hypothetical protein